MEDNSTEIIIQEKGEMEKPPPRPLTPINMNQYSTMKTLAQGLMDIGLLASNISTLKYVLHLGSSYYLYNLMLVFISMSIILQMSCAMCLIFLGAKDVNEEKNHKSAQVLNNAVTAQVFLITVINIIMASLGFEQSGFGPPGNSTTPSG